MNQVSIKDFYKGKNIFVTGGTGFIGKTLVEKLLWSCPDLEKIFIIVRAKKDKDIQDRVNDIINCPAFDRIRARDPELLNKIVPLAGDITMENLGFSEEDLERFYDNVNVIFHSAASIRMDEPFKDAINNNTVPTKRLIGMAKKCKNLDVFVHVSTSYSNYYLKCPQEVAYLPPYDPNDIITMTRTMPDNIQKEVEPILMNSMNGVPINPTSKIYPQGVVENILEYKGSRSFPNTYTFSKFFAEAFVTLEGEGIPRAIVRPSIVISAVKEPMPGWIDNWGGPAERCVQVSNGIIHHIHAQPSIRLDIVPVDLVVNCTIAAGCKAAIEKSKDVQVFTASTAELTPTMKELFDTIQENARKVPFDRLMWWPFVTISNDKFSSKILPFLYHTMPAYFLDVVRITQGKKPAMVKLTKVLDKIYGIVRFGTNIPSHYYNTKAQKLAVSLSPSDQKEFPFDTRLINWKECLGDFTFGVKKYLLKEDCSPEAIRKGQQKLKRLKLIHYGTKYALIGGSLLLAGSLLRCTLKSNEEKIYTLPPEMQGESSK